MNDWEIIHHQATKLKEANTEWTSLGGRVKYKFVHIDENRIVVDRLNGGEKATLGRKGVTNAIGRLKQKGRLERTELIGSVARQTTLVYLHPFVNWDNSKKEVYWHENSLTDVFAIIQEASDDELNKIQSLINKRKNQSLFRKNLMTLYKGTCPVSGMNVNEVLEAAHIVSHSIKGINSNDNGILLRSDLHKLFDKNLLLINPNTLEVSLHSSLKNTEYEKFSGKRIGKRIDDSEISYEYLKSKWESAKWTQR